MEILLASYLLWRAYRALTSYLLWRAAQEKPMPRRLTFVMDVSGSMYRFNGHDGRLNKMLETTCLVMEARAAEEQHATSYHLPRVTWLSPPQALAAEELRGRYEYSIVGHSGETDGEEFVSFALPPRDRGDRLKAPTIHLPSLYTYHPRTPY